MKGYDPPLTGWMGADVKNHFTCPRCNQLPSKGCRKPSGGLTYQSHLERYKLATPEMREACTKRLGLS